MKRFVLYVLLAILPASLLTASSSSASAALQPCGTKSNYHDGFRKSTSDTYTTYGVSAQVRIQHGPVCLEDESQGNFSSAWTMLSSQTGRAWAQTGYVRWWNHGVVHFSQWLREPGAFLHTDFGETRIFADELHQYWTLRASSPNCPNTSICLVGHIDQTTWFYTTFDPNAFGEWSKPYLQYYMGETAYRESDIPGTSSNKTGYNFMQYVNSSNQWVTQPCGLTEINDVPTRWAKETISCSHRRIWTFNP